MSEWSGRTQIGLEAQVIGLMETIRPRTCRTTRGAWMTAPLWWLPFNLRTTGYRLWGEQTKSVSIPRRKVTWATRYGIYLPQLFQDPGFAAGIGYPDFRLMSKSPRFERGTQPVNSA